MASYLLVHGSWHGGWCWDEVKDILEGDGHTVFAPTLLGMDYRNESVPRDVGLREHVEFIEDFIIKNNLDDFILVGHSYAGMIVTWLALKIPGKISKLVYLDAFLPEPGQSLFDISPPERVEAMEKSLIDENGQTSEQGGNNPYLLPIRSPETFGITAPEMRKRIMDKLVPTPVKTFSDKIDHGTIPPSLSKIYIRCTECSLFEKFEIKAKEKGFLMYQIKTGHDAMIIKPEELAYIFENLLLV